MKYLLILLCFINISLAQIDNELKDKANQGNSDAQYALGESYYNGVGVKQDYLEAAKWYKLAGNQGNFNALFKLGMMYKKGEGVERNPLESFKLLALVAYYGNDATAQFLTGMSYLDGKVIAQNYEEASSWFESSCNNGNQKACTKYKELNTSD